MSLSYYFLSTTKQHTTQKTLQKILIGIFWENPGFVRMAIAFNKGYRSFSSHVLFVNNSSRHSLPNTD
ncbi:hypothetical protein BpHYR1_035001 [Brachionus plicatilis]|uniref:Uncharacterized protein n=1 Tax=Brachionus plicatilis TaxID=10195 RepID=A0A3M7Q0T6_BRAPC|nr:hypothetical protein BpHYR1_035001 [Brachionus plicatilis]